MAIARIALCLAVLLLALQWRQGLSQGACSPQNTENFGSNDIRTLDGGTVCFQCFFGGSLSSDPATTWRFSDGSSIPPEEGDVTDGVLRIFDTIVTFSSTVIVIVCRLEGEGQYDLGFTVSAFELPIIEDTMGNPITDVTLNETADTLDIFCDTSNSAPTPAQRWLNPQGNVVSTFAELMISNIMRGQAGQYTCQVENTAGDTLNSTVDITVQYRPDVSTAITSPHLSPLNRLLTLTCDYDAIPTPDITWLRDGVELTPGSDADLTINSDTSSSVLMLDNLMVEEGGTYTCVADNIVGDNSVTITVQVQGLSQGACSPQNTENFGSNDIRTLDGGTVCFQCFFGGSLSSDPATTWRFSDGSSIPPEEGDVTDGGVLRIFDTTVTFSSTVRVIVCRLEGEGQYDLGFTVSAFELPIIEDTMGNPITDVTLNETADTLDIFCDISNSVPTPAQRWLNPQGNVVSTSAELTISNITRGQAGQYTCQVESTAGDTLNSTVDIVVQYRPDVSTAITSPHLSPLNQLLTLTCDYDAIPTPDITWLRDGVELTPGSDLDLTILSDTSSSVLMLDNLLVEEGGTYTCVADNIVGDSNVTITVQVQGLSQPEPDACSPQNTENFNSNDIRTLGRGTVCFQCFFGGSLSSDPATTWRFSDGSSIPPEEGDVTDGVLRIFDTTVTFSSTTTVIVCRLEGEGQYDLGFTVSAFELPIIEDTMNIPITDVTLNETADTLDIFCDISNSAPTPAQRWLDPQGNVMTTTGDLTISNITRDQAGQYTCQVENTAGDTLNSTVDITVQYLPDVSTAITSPHLSPLNQLLTLTCDYDAIPAPDITWLRDGVELTPGSDADLTINSDTSSSVLMLDNLMVEEGGTYTCVADNIVGDSNVTITIQVQVPPDAPTNVMVVDMTTTTISLSWTNGFDGLSLITGVDIEYEVQGSGSTQTMSIDGDSSTESATLTDLMPFTTYEIRVFVRNMVGRSTPNNTVTRTDSLTLDAPTVTLGVVNSTELLLSWMPPAVDSSTTAAIESWRVEYRRVDLEGELQTRDIDNETITSLSLSGLEKGTDYEARVAGTNEAGPGDFSGFVPQQTAVDPPSAPRNVTVVGVSASVLEISWEAPEDDGGRPLLNYTVEIRDLSDNESNLTNFTVVEVVSVEEVLMVTIRDGVMVEGETVMLQENTTYQVRVRANNEVDGDPQPILDAATVLGVTNDSATLEWAFPGGTVSNYIVQYKLRRHDFSDGPPNVQERTVMETNITITGLMPDMMYEARVTTMNRNGVSPRYSPLASFTTNANPPTLTITPTNTDVTAGDTVTLICSTDDGSTPSVTWTREDENGTVEMLPPGADPQGNRLVFMDPQPNDSGQYVCTVGAGTPLEARVTFSLQVEEEPTPTPTTIPPDGGDGESSQSDNTGAIVGGVVAGVAVVSISLFILLVITYLVLKNRRAELALRQHTLTEEQLELTHRASAAQRPHAPRVSPDELVAELNPAYHTTLPHAPRVSPDELVAELNPAYHTILQSQNLQQDISTLDEGVYEPIPGDTDP